MFHASKLSDFSYKMLLILLIAMIQLTERTLFYNKRNLNQQY